MPDHGVVPLEQDLGFLLSRASGLVVRSTNAALAEHGLRVRQYSVLVLACGDGPGVSQRGIAEVLGLDPSQVVLLVDELEAAGLVVRRPSAADRRTRLVSATRRGRTVRSAAAASARAGLDGPLAPLADEEREVLAGLLGRVVADRG